MTERATVQATFWGVRGSIAAPGPEFNRYGGNTACVSVHGPSQELLILDAGTGVTNLGRALAGERFGRGGGEATLFLTHGHWDHIQGFPFFAPVYIAGNRLVIYGPSESPAMVEGMLEGQMNPHFSPVQSLRNLGAEIEFRAMRDGERVSVGGLAIQARAVPHGRINALAYRIEHEDRALVFAPDAGYLDGVPTPEVIQLFRGARYLIHDCTYTPEDQAVRVGRGNASIAIAARVAVQAGVGALVMFHYDQDYTDEQVDALAQRCRQFLDDEGGQAVELIAAREGLTLAF